MVLVIQNYKQMGLEGRYLRLADGLLSFLSKENVLILQVSADKVLVPISKLDLKAGLSEAKFSLMPCLTLFSSVLY